jgi:hypothetical protein
MLQRPQTIYLLLVTIFSILLMTGGLASFSLDGAEYVLKHTGLTDPEGTRTGLNTWPMTTLFIGAAVLAFLDIFSYRNRTRQMRIAIFLIFIFAGMIAMILYYVTVAKGQLEGASVLYRWRVVIPPISAILTYFAFRRIRRDELVVKAYERIR